MILRPYQRAAVDRKRCTRCGALKLRARFGASQREKDGLQSWCKDCKADHYRAHRADVLAKCREYRKRNSAAKRNKDRDYYQRNREARLAKAAEYRQRNIDKIRAYDRSEARKHPDRKKKTNVRVAAWAKKNQDRRLASHARRRAILKGRCAGSIDDTAPFYSLIRSASRLRCHWCRRIVAKSRRHVDHIIPLTRGGAHTLSNLCCACSTCNLSKGSKTPVEFTGQRALL